MQWLLICAILLIPTYMAALAYTQLTNFTALHERITMSTNETQQAIDNVVAQLTKSHQELSAELAKATADISNQLADAGVEVDLSALTSIAQQLDDLVPDAVTPEVDAPVDAPVDAEAEAEVDAEVDVPVEEPVDTDVQVDDKAKKFRP